MFQHLVYHDSDYNTELVWHASPGPVSNTSSELLKPDRPSAPTRTLYAVPGVKPFNTKKLREPFTISFFQSSLPTKILGKQHSGILIFSALLEDSRQNSVNSYLTKLWTG